MCKREWHDKVVNCCNVTNAVFSAYCEKSITFLSIAFHYLFALFDFWFLFPLILLGLTWGFASWGSRLRLSLDKLHRKTLRPAAFAGRVHRNNWKVREVKLDFIFIIYYIYVFYILLTLSLNLFCTHSLTYSLSLPFHPPPLLLLLTPFSFLCVCTCKCSYVLISVALIICTVQCSVWL